MSSSRVIGCIYFMVILLIAQLSTHMHMLPSFLGTRRAGTSHELKLSLTKPLDINSSTDLLDLHGLLRIHPIRWFVRKNGSGNEVYLVLDGPYWGQPGGVSSRNT